MDSQEYKIACTVFDRIRTSFPNLAMTLDSHHPQVDLGMDIPAQSGLDFKIWLDLQGDELTLSASRFWYEWFPCRKEEVVEKYFQAVSGLVSGRFRIVQHWRGRRIVKTELQSPDGDKWKTVASSINISALVPWPPKKLRVIQNGGGPAFAKS